MPKKIIKPRIAIEMEILPQEIEIDNSNTPKFSIQRREKDIIEKTKNGLWKLEELFINEQEARRNSEYTIKHYKRTFKKIYEFFAFTCGDDLNNIDKIYDQYEKDQERLQLSGESAMSYAGKMFPIASLEMNDLQRAFGEYLTDIDEVNEQTVISYFRDFRAIMYFAMENGWITPYRITIKDKGSPIKNCYTNAELDKLLRKPLDTNFTEYRDWVIINYLLATGNRIQTIINIRVGDIDIEEGYVNINVQKNSNTSRIGLVRKMVNILRDYITYYRCDDDGNPLLDEYLFCNRYGEKMSDNGLKQAVISYNRRRGVQKTSIHLFRHTFAKNWIISGGDLISLQKMLGQTSLKMVQQYANLYASDVKEKAEEHALLAQTQTKSGKTLQKRSLQKRG